MRSLTPRMIVSSQHRVMKRMSGVWMERERIPKGRRSVTEMVWWMAEVMGWMHKLRRWVLKVRVLLLLLLKTF
jgi:hypothetical protein